MGGLIKLLLLAAALYLAYGYFVRGDTGLSSWLPQPPRMRTPEDGEPRREPGRGLNPFVLDGDPAPAPQRPRIPDIPGAKR
ncbi:MAG: hypothetical protein ACREQQ_03565 [Candidatus Binatia bacterium]